jgi:radical SAM-linked protein
MTMQRLRIEFSKGEELRAISHLDLMRALHRALRRARVPLTYSEGFVPRPRLSLAAPLAVGATGEAELMDVYLQRRMSPLTVLKAVNAQFPAGLEARTVEEVPPSLPSLQSLVQAADYLVRGRTAKPRAAMTESIERLLSLRSLPWEHRREDETRQYDLRPLVLDLRLESWEEDKDGDEADFVLGMRLRADGQGTGRPDQVVAALGFPDEWTSIRRTRLVLQRAG